MGEELNPTPSNLTDAAWKHGSTDGEVFTVIRDGVKSTGMKAYARKMTTHQVWDVVNYIRSIGPKTGSE
jgi:mono/diheme cytochrome c family protein